MIHREETFGVRRYRHKKRRLSIARLVRKRLSSTLGALSITRPYGA